MKFVQNRKETGNYLPIIIRLNSFSANDPNAISNILKDYYSLTYIYIFIQASLPSNLSLDECMINFLFCTFTIFFYIYEVFKALNKLSCST